MSVCRTCLNTNSRMHDLRTTRLRQMFEKLTNVQVGVEKMSAICYICYSQLQRCQRFVHMSQTADRILRQAFSKQPVIMSPGELVATNALVVTPVEVMSLGDPPGGADTLVKQEPVYIKEEGDEEEPELGVQELEVELQLSPTKLEDLGSLPDPGHGTSISGTELDCSECGKQFHRRKNLSRHVLHVHTRQKVPCEHCRGGYAARYLKEHMLRCKASPAAGGGRVPAPRAPPAGGRYTCDYCGREFPRKGGLASHVRVHTGERPFACARCARRFSQQSSLRKHAASHAQRRLYICDVCRKGFVYKPALVVHLRTHSGERPHACRVCGKGFSQRGHMRIHARSHDGRKPHSCRACGRAFAYRSTARRHERRHAAADWRPAGGASQ